MKVHATWSVIMFLGVWRGGIAQTLRVVYCTRYSSEEDLDRRSSPGVVLDERTKRLQQQQQQRQMDTY
uniref:Putative secreted protein n=1 Tax=Anopheles marajoara TaxID=58244 RepID=A0A2M4CF54_9DIPT